MEGRMTKKERHRISCFVSRISKGFSRFTIHGSRATAILLALFFLVASCATSFDKQGKFHTVRRGDDFWSIAKAYNVDAQKLAEENNIQDPHALAPGTRLYIPQLEKPKAHKQISIEGVIGQEQKSRTSRATKKGSKVKISKIYVNHNRFAWPAEGKLTSTFGVRGGRRHDGIDIANKTGTEISAADRGTVVYSGRLRGYGNIIIIKHHDDLFTVYAHNHKNLVQKGQNVKRQQKIALMGCTGRCTGPHVHFEVREGQIARNPLFFLPKR
jgi:murein DD-endopeptidase MepM/ murein hydrolase activator NlpD